VHTLIHLLSELLATRRLRPAVGFPVESLAFLPPYRLLLPDEDVSSADALAHAREYIISLLVHGMTVDLEQDGDNGEEPQPAERKTGPMGSNE
jgi:hypothetical protein